MFRKTLLTVLAAGVASVAMPAYAQSDEAGRQDVTVQAFGSFVLKTTQDSIDNKATKSGGVLASYRVFFSNHYGVEANYGYALNTQKYISGTGVTGVNTNSHEVSGDFVFREPLGKITPFVLAGAGALVFDPKDYSGATSQTRAAFVYGGGLDYSLTHRLFMRAEYRGFVYNSPTYGLLALSGMDRVTHRAEPSIGFGYRF
jgi:outer membrane immunogenic protein